MKLIIQIPCYNEAETLLVTLNDLPEHIDGIDTIEYLIINDGSSDETERIAKEWGVHHIVHHKRNLGLAKGFLNGIDLALRQGADIIVNTDADNQYCGEDIAKLVQPILEKKADIVVGERPIDDIEEFSWMKKKLQRFGSKVVRIASKADIPDAPSGFRAYSRHAAMRMNVNNEYTYTLETLVQAGRNKMAIMSVPIRTNPELRDSRLMNNIGSYIKKSALTILRAILMYRPLQVFTIIGAVFMVLGSILGIRFLYFYFTGGGSGHVQSLILTMLLIVIGVQSLMLAMQADVISANRKLLEDVQFRVKKLEFGLLDAKGNAKATEQKEEEVTNGEENGAQEEW